VKESKRTKRLKEKKITHKLGIIVPYRDREQQLKRFLSHMKDYIKDIDYEIFIVEQTDDKPFNRGKLLNAGYKYALDKGCDYFVFHDVDMLPEDVDYSYSDKPLHLATHLQEHDYETTFFDYFGGVTMFTKEDFKTINGFSNEYWGWGFEDDDLLIRCIQAGLDIDKEVFGNSNVSEIHSFKLDGDRSYIKISTKDSILLEDDFTISVLVKPEEIKLSKNKDYDEFPILSIPGYNIGLFYNSFRRYFCQTYDLNKKAYSISSDIMGEAWTHLTMTYEDNKFISFYVNGELIEKIEMDTEILQLSTDEIFVGAPNSKKTNKEFLIGKVGVVEIYDVGLDSNEVKSIYENPTTPKIRNFDNFISSEFLLCQILPEFSNKEECIDIAQQNNIKLYNTYLYKGIESFKSYLPKPHRRESRFKSLKHKSNSSIGNKWIHSDTRKNQIRFYNEVREDFDNYKIEGLNTLRFKEKKVSKKKLVNIIKISL
jgi:hypothetical protein